MVLHSFCCSVYNMCVCVGGWVGGWVCVGVCVWVCVCVLSLSPLSVICNCADTYTHSLSLCLSVSLSQDVFLEDKIFLVKKPDG